MPTYTYRCPEHGEFEWQHSINDKLETCPLCEENSSSEPPCKVERLISSGGTFVLTGSGWAKDNYG